MQPLFVLVAAWVVAVQPIREVISECQALFSLAAGVPALAEAHKCQALFSSAAGVAGFGLVSELISKCQALFSSAAVVAGFGWVSRSQQVQ